MSQGKWSIRSLLFITFLLWVIINIIAYNCRILNRLDETLLLYCYSGVRKSKYEILTSTFPFRTPSKVKIISQFPSDATKRLKYYSLILESTHYLNNQTEIKRAILRFMDFMYTYVQKSVTDSGTERRLGKFCTERSATTGACDFSFYCWHGGVSSTAFAWVIFHPEIAEWYTELGKRGMSWQKKHHVPRHSKLPK